MFHGILWELQIWSALFFINIAFYLQIEMEWI